MVYGGADLYASYDYGPHTATPDEVECRDMSVDESSWETKQKWPFFQHWPLNFVYIMVTMGSLCAETQEGIRL
jgi:hypothetical protein